ncbi:MAG: S-layer homology domain-containing protein [Rothia sp. (in: high G+C Gram-positive bacteria)]|uniref:S-layer homology domain-containing protein n=1 Tax=Rothia sp. (in: high G+C Gram-positive bacteria) TaxID=1885016 RepID=UPI0026DEDC86|nr:S-layer homology domain-containing protein [Rothia sp. (in: high G+C Gram-positive bacteria)]MDO5750939.1 S-layer homology domain-containing protein [Rothia sp. (in: high G+C Gram-positive bacteria)]
MAHSTSARTALTALSLGAMLSPSLPALAAPADAAPNTPAPEVQVSAAQEVASPELDTRAVQAPPAAHIPAAESAQAAPSPISEALEETPAFPLIAEDSTEETGTEDAAREAAPIDDSERIALAVARHGALIAGTSYNLISLEYEDAFSGKPRAMVFSVYEHDAGVDPREGVLILKKDAQGYNVRQHTYEQEIALNHTIDGAKVYTVVLETQDREGTPAISHVQLPVRAGFKADTPQSERYSLELAWAAERGIVSDTSEEFASKRVSRGELTEYFYRLAGSPEVYLPETSPFEDISPNHPNYAAIIWASDQGLSRGWSDGKYHADAQAGHATMAAFMYRFSGHAHYVSGGPYFKDVPSGSSFFREIDWAAHYNLVPQLSTEGSRFYPHRALTRAETAAFLMRLDAYIFEDIRG